MVILLGLLVSDHRRRGPATFKWPPSPDSNCAVHECLGQLLINGV